MVLYYELLSDVGVAELASLEGGAVRRLPATRWTRRSPWRARSSRDSTARRRRGRPRNGFRPFLPEGVPRRRAAGRARRGRKGVGSLRRWSPAPPGASHRKSAARRLIAQGGVEVNGERATDPSVLLPFRRRLLIPAIDLRAASAYALLQGRFDAETVYASDPLEVLERYLTLGARQVHVVDLDGARDGSQGNRAVIGASPGAPAAAPSRSAAVCALARSPRSCSISGVARAVVGSVAVTQPDEVASWLGEFGPGPGRARVRRAARRGRHPAPRHARLGAPDPDEPVGRGRALPAGRPAPRAVHRPVAREARCPARTCPCMPNASAAIRKSRGRPPSA